MNEELAIQNRVCIVTGANSGVGKEVAREFVRRGAHLVMLCRNLDKAVAARRELQQENPQAQIDVLIADLSNMQQVRTVAADIIQKYPVITLLINNAGGHIVKRQMSADGCEMNFAVNVLGPFLLTNLLLPTLRKSPQSRIVNVASEAHRVGAKMTFDDFQNEQSLQFLAYMRAKFYMMLLTQAFAKRLDGSGVSVNAICPGFVAGNFYKGLLNPLMRGLARLQVFTIISPLQGRVSTLKAALAPEYADKRGEFIGTHPITVYLGTAKQVFNTDYQERLWQYMAHFSGWEEVA